jgi:REP element-mobilizing transposase RayT
MPLSMEVMMKQIKMNIYKGQRGGRRPGSGRKRIHSKGVSHRIREKISKRTPLHINFKFRIPIKNKVALKLLKRAIVNGRGHGLRVLHFSLQHNHIHLIIEADNNAVLTKGMRSLTVTFAKGLEQGRIQLERYHLHVLKTVKETKHAINYVLFNKQKHEKGTYSVIDEYTSFPGWQLIKKFTQKKRMTLKVGRIQVMEKETAISFLYLKSLSLLQT